VRSTKRLKESNWARIEEEAAIYMQILDRDSDDGDGEDDAEADSMRVKIDIDWYVHPSPIVELQTHYYIRKHPHFYLVLVLQDSE
jgi:hypothetical protein